jgi:hypothetical protein
VLTLVSVADHDIRFGCQDKHLNPIAIAIRRCLPQGLDCWTDSDSVTICYGNQHYKTPLPEAAAARAMEFESTGFMCPFRLP